MINIAKPLMGEEEKQAVLDVLDSGMIACGSVVSEFEKEFADYLGIEYCTATTSGTTALPSSKVMVSPGACCLRGTR